MKTYTETVFFLHVECVHTDEIKKNIKYMLLYYTYFYFLYFYIWILKNINTQYSIFASLFY